MKKSGDSYERLWFSPLQYADMEIGKTVDFEAKVIVDDPDADAIAVAVSDPYEHKTISYISIENIEVRPLVPLMYLTIWN